MSPAERYNAIAAWLGWLATNETLFEEERQELAELADWCSMQAEITASEEGREP